MRVRTSLLICMLLATTAALPVASARPVCVPDPQPFDTITGGPSAHDFTCEEVSNAILVWGYNIGVFPAVPAAYVVCFVDDAGNDHDCEDGCGYQLLDRKTKATHIRVHVDGSLGSACPALVGEVAAEFAYI